MIFSLDKVHYYVILKAVYSYWKITANRLASQTQFQNGNGGMDMINNQGTQRQSLSEAQNQGNRPPSPAHRVLIPAHRVASDPVGQPREVT